MESNFSKDDNEKISLACCYIFVHFSSYPSTDEVREDSLSIIELIKQNDWAQLFKNKNWLSYLEKAVHLNEEVKPVLEQLDVLFCYFKAEIIKLVKHQKE